MKVESSVTSPSRPVVPPNTARPLTASPLYRCSSSIPECVFSWLYMTPFTAVFQYRRLFPQSRGQGSSIKWVVCIWELTNLSSSTICWTLHTISNCALFSYLKMTIFKWLNTNCLFWHGDHLTFVICLLGFVTLCSGTITVSLCGRSYSQFLSIWKAFAFL